MVVGVAVGRAKYVATESVGVAMGRAKNVATESVVVGVAVGEAKMWQLNQW